MTHWSQVLNYHALNVVLDATHNEERQPQKPLLLRTGGRTAVDDCTMRYETTAERVFGGIVSEQSTVSPGGAA